MISAVRQGTMCKQERDYQIFQSLQYFITDIEYIESDIASGKATCGKQERGFSRGGKSASSL